jgi:hypothetical protein
MRGASAGIAALALLLAACAGWKPYAADEPIAPHMSLQVTSYAAGTGAYRAVLHNDSRRTVGYLPQLWTYSRDPHPERYTWFDLPGGYFHSAIPLPPGRSAVITGECSAGTCAEHFGVHVCWLDTDGCATLEIVWTNAAVASAQGAHGAPKDSGVTPTDRGPP